MLNALAEKGDVDMFAILGDNLYDQDGTASASLLTLYPHVSFGVGGRGVFNSYSHRIVHQPAYGVLQCRQVDYSTVSRPLASV